MNNHYQKIASLFTGFVILTSSASAESKIELTDEAEKKLSLIDEKVVKEKKKKAETAENTTVPEAPPLSVDPDILKKSIDAGKTVYISCQACHQPTGAGIPSVFPPLAKSNWVNGLENAELAKIVLFGLSGPIEVNGTPYASAMAPLGAMLTDEKVSDVLNYVKNSWGNKGGYISPDEVKVVREEYAGKPMLTAADIKGADSLK